MKTSQWERWDRWVTDSFIEKESKTHDLLHTDTDSKHAHIHTSIHPSSVTALSLLWGRRVFAGWILDKSPTHRRALTDGREHQEQFRVQYLAQGHFNMQLSSAQLYINTLQYEYTVHYYVLPLYVPFNLRFMRSCQVWWGGKDLLSLPLPVKHETKWCTHTTHTHTIIASRNLACRFLCSRVCVREKSEQDTEQDQKTEKPEDEIFFSQCFSTFPVLVTLTFKSYPLGK